MSAYDLHHYTCGPITVVVAHYIEHGGHTEIRGFYVDGHAGREVDPEDEKAPFLEAGLTAGFPATLSADEIAERLGREAITAYDAGKQPCWAHREGADRRKVAAEGDPSVHWSRVHPILRRLVVDIMRRSGDLAVDVAPSNLFAQEGLTGHDVAVALCAAAVELEVADPLTAAKARSAAVLWPLVHPLLRLLVCDVVPAVGVDLADSVRGSGRENARIRDSFARYGVTVDEVSCAFAAANELLKVVAPKVDTATREKFQAACIDKYLSEDR